MKLIKITKEEYHANKKLEDGSKNPLYFCRAIYFSNSFNGYSYYRIED